MLSALLPANRSYDKFIDLPAPQAFHIDYATITLLVHLVKETKPMHMSFGKVLGTSV